jgi:cytochrome c5
MSRSAVVIIAAFFAISILAGAVSAQTVLFGAREAFQEECSRCHEPDRALDRMKDEEAWESTVARMSKYAKAKYKAPIADETQATIVEYLTARYVLERSCTSCHADDRVLKATYDRDGWEESVELMESMGAMVVDGKRELLIDYLTEYAGDGE